MRTLVDYRRMSRNRVRMDVDRAARRFVPAPVPIASPTRPTLKQVLRRHPDWSRRLRRILRGDVVVPARVRPRRVHGQ